MNMYTVQLLYYRKEDSGSGMCKTDIETDIYNYSAQINSEHTGACNELK